MERLKLIKRSSKNESKSQQLKKDDLIGNKFVLLQRGKKNYFVVRVL